MKSSGVAFLVAARFADAIVSLPAYQFARDRYQLPNFFSKKGTERDHLKEYVEDLDKRIALIAPHCELKKLNMSR